MLQVSRLLRTLPVSVGSSQLSSTRQESGKRRHQRQTRSLFLTDWRMPPTVLELQCQSNDNASIIFTYILILCACYTYIVYLVAAAICMLTAAVRQKAHDQIRV